MKSTLSRKSAILSVFLSVLSGCGGGGGGESIDRNDDNQANSDSSFNVDSSFRISNITASNLDAKKLVLKWTSAFNGSGVNYKVCLKDTSQIDNCGEIAYIEDAYTITVPVYSLVDAINVDYFVLATKDNEKKITNEEKLNSETVNAMIGYIKASNTGEFDEFGQSVSLSSDGKTLAVGAWAEDNAGVGVTTTAQINDIDESYNSGAVYLFRNVNDRWTQTAYIKSSNTDQFDFFGYSISLSGDGNSLAVGAYGEDNAEKGVITNSSEKNDIGLASNSGAVYLFSNASGEWDQIAYLKASNSQSEDHFGFSVSLNDDGTSLAVGAYGEDNGFSGIVSDGSETTDASIISDSGAVYLFTKEFGNWSQTTYLKASNPGQGDLFGYAVALSGNGSSLAIGAWSEDSSAGGVLTDNSETTNSGEAINSGAVYLFTKGLGQWNQIAYVKASKSGSGDSFGKSLSLNNEGNVLAVGAPNESNTEKGIIFDGSEIDSVNHESGVGAVYLFSSQYGSWQQIAYVKASNSGANDYFGASVSLDYDGHILGVGAYSEDNSISGVIKNGSEVNDTGSSGFGAAYLFDDLSGNWSQKAYIKASNPLSASYFGGSIAVSSDAIAVGAKWETSGVVGVSVNGKETTQDNASISSGAVYLF